MSNNGRHRLTVIDATFLRIESANTPMHVASLQTFTKPAGAGPEFVADIVTAYRAGEVTAPWNLRLVGGIAARVAPAVEVADVIDMEYHVRHTALPSPGGERQLGELISYLHGVQLDRSRPLWTCTVIDGVDGDRFAIYLKVHHALTDGVNGIRMATSALADEPDGSWRAPWQPAPPREKRVRRATAASANPLGALSTSASIVRGAAGMLWRRRQAELVRRPFDAPPSALNRPITAARRVATQQIELSRLQDVARTAGVSVNDVFLAITGTAIRRRMLDADMLPAAPLVAGVPVSLREEGEIGGNAVAMSFASLATDLADPLDRLEAIHASTAAAKDHLRAMPLAARRIFSVLTAAPVSAALATGIGTVRRPPMNLVISNVPGPPNPKYLNGARMQAIYPVSVTVTGQALNVTAITYAGEFNIGFTGARDSLPSLQRVAGYTSDALAELEAALAPPPTRRLRSATQR